MLAKFEDNSEHHEAKIFIFLSFKTNYLVWFAYGESKDHMLVVHFFAEIRFYIFWVHWQDAQPAPGDGVNTPVS